MPSFYGEVLFGNFSKGGSVSEFLGINITQESRVGHKFMQEGFIKIIMLTTGMNKLNKVLKPTKLV